MTRVCLTSESDWSESGFPNSVLLEKVEFMGFMQTLIQFAIDMKEIQPNLQKWAAINDA